MEEAKHYYKFRQLNYHYSNAKYFSSVSNKDIRMVYVYWFYIHNIRMNEILIICIFTFSFIANAYFNYLIYKRDVAIINRLVDIVFPIKANVVLI